MKGFIAKMVTTACLGGGLTTGLGCYGYHDLVDPCYPERYNFAARQETKGSLAPQVQNGHILDQTVWNYHFESGSAALTEAGKEHLAYLARRRPNPDTTIYLQVAQDISFDASNLAASVDARNALDNKRIQMIQDFLTGQTAGRNVSFNVVRHDPGEVGISAVPAGVSIRGLQVSSQGTLSPATGGGGAGGGQGGAR